MRQDDVQAAVVHARLRRAQRGRRVNVPRPGVKICGVTRVVDALVALEAGADALGFILASGSPRRLEPAEAQALVGAIRDATKQAFEAVAVLGGYDAPAARRALLDARLRPRPARRRGAAACAVRCAARARSARRARLRRRARARRVEPRGPRGRACDAVLLDTYRKGALGGTGHVFDWDLAAPLAARRRVVLAGGLTPSNVAEAVARVKPWRVDVASGVEDAPGIKNADEDPRVRGGGMELKRGPDASGHFGRFGGRFAPETLMTPLAELEAAYAAARKRPGVRARARRAAARRSAAGPRRSTARTGSRRRSAAARDLSQARGPAPHRRAQDQQHGRPGAADDAHGQAARHRRDRRGPARRRDRGGGGALRARRASSTWARRTCAAST